MLNRRTLLGVLVGLMLVGVSCGIRPPPDLGAMPQATRPPSLRPDYTDTVIPPNIAPLNFTVRERGSRFFARLTGERGGAPIEVTSGSRAIRIPLRAWRQLLAANTGATIHVEVAVMDEAGAWTRFATVTNRVAAEPIDRYLAYRQIDPAYNYWGAVSVQQRDLESFDEWPVLHNRQFSDGCLNCHSFRENATDHMTIGIRSGVHGSSTVMVVDGETRKIGTSFGYTAWHPSGQVVCYSVSKVHQFFHWARAEVRDVVDLDSELAYYDLRSRTAKTAPGIADPDRLETYPTWTPDGKQLYFCSAAFPWQIRTRMPPANYEKCRYDLRRISYDVDTDTWGEPETVLSSDDTGKSIMLPRVSPDGRWLVFCMCEYGCFPIYQPSSDLYVMDLKTGKHRQLRINSDRSESWHSWSSNGRWLAFSSKRRDGLFTRPYFSYVDASGRFHRPFILPQKDPAFYDSFLKTYSVPELVRDRVPVRSLALAGAVTGLDEVKVESPVSFGPKQPATPSDYHDAPPPWQPGR